MEVSAAVSAPVSNAIESLPPRDNTQLSSPQNRVTPSSETGLNSQQGLSSTAQTSAPDPNARVGSTIDTFV